jgi:hypothetical protein
MAAHREPAPIAIRAPPPHQINSWPLIYEPAREIRTRAYPFTDLIWTVNLVTDAHRLMNPIDP